jgi:lipoate-protein ligase A
MNLACDHALLEMCEAGRLGGVLRFWAPTNYFVVVGYGNRIGAEVDGAACEARGIPVLRRCSGGGTVLQGPGCLNYALIAPAEGPLATITGANRHIMEAHRRLFSELMGCSVQVQGITDLVVDGRKFSGNAQRRKRNWLLFHGTFLLDMDIPLIETLLRRPSLEPDYREGRSHEAFLMNTGLSADRIKAALCRSWGASEPLALTLEPETRQLVAEKYSRPEWNHKNI